MSPWPGAFHLFLTAVLTRMVAMAKQQEALKETLKETLLELMAV